jgi:hypothetical protein
LACLAINILFIPVILDLVEKVFFSVKQTISNRRILLGSNIIEAIECLRNWLLIKDFNQKVRLVLKAEQ